MYGRGCGVGRFSFSALAKPDRSRNPISHYNNSALKTLFRNEHLADYEEQFATLCSKGYIKEAFENFLCQLWSQPTLFSHLLQSCIPRKSVSLLKQLHALIITSGCSSNKFISNHLLILYSKFGNLQTAAILFDRMPRRNVMTCNILIHSYIQSGDLGSAAELFVQMPERSLATWNTMIAGLTRFGKNEEAMVLFSGMYEVGFMPDNFTLGSVLKGCASLRGLFAGQQVHAYVMKCGFEFHLVVGTSLAHMYMKAGSLKDGEKVIKSLPIHNVIAWNTLIAGEAQNGYSEEVLYHYRMMKMSGSMPDKVTFVSVISSCSDLATLRQGKQVHGEAIKAGSRSVVSVTTSLINMYSKCGCLEDCVKVFLERKESDVVLWSSMISAYGFHGQGQEAILLFQQMELEKLQPNEVTFLSLLYACSHCGLKDRGLEFFDLMVEKYALKPRLKHYTCIVDLLGRAGFLEEAEAMIRSMPEKEDAVIWKTLLSACKIHKNAEMARRVAEEIHRIDPQDSASYVLLSIIHASAKRWQDVSKVRDTMRDRNLEKEPGISWLEVKNQTHQFCMDDRSHPKSVEIYWYLGGITSEMKLHGYVSDPSIVLHDMHGQ